LIGVVIAGGYGFYRIIVHNEGLAQLGLISFVAVAQLLPGVLALLFWPRANQVGFLCGLLGGGLVWFGTLIVPLLVNSHILTTEADFGAIFGPGATSVWTVATFWSLAANALLLVLGSLLSRQTREEKEAALACTEHSLIPLRGQVSAASPADFQKRLARIMGTTAADQEVAKALDELQLPMHEHRPAELRLLRERIERNLSGLLGPALARMVVGDRLQLRQKSHVALADSIRFMEERLQDSNTRIRGVVAELDHLRRYHRQVLHELPIGVCALGPDGEVVIWNFAMQVISGVDSRAAIGNTLDQLSAPWNKVLGAFTASADRHLSKQRYTIQNRPRWLNLHKAEIETPGIGQMRDAGGLAILVEDRTELETLEAGLTHSERLASIGRLAAGVAHEIGNPLTGIACLAQNLEAETDRELVLQSARDILSQTKRISSIVRSLLTFSHPENMSVGERAQFELRECAEEAIRLVRLSHRGKNVECANRCDAGLKIHGDRQRILQVLVNLLSNACDASQPGDQVAVGASGIDDTATIRIRDQGQGIPEHLQEHIFEPFFTTKNVGEGTGLGLSLVHNIVRDHDGSISVRSNAGWGTEITIRLPCEPKAQPKVMVQ
jgi:signal transduction histidine kinase